MAFRVKNSSQAALKRFHIRLACFLGTGPDLLPFLLKLDQILGGLPPVGIVPECFRLYAEVEFEVVVMDLLILDLAEIFLLFRK